MDGLWNENTHNYLRCLNFVCLLLWWIKAKSECQWNEASRMTYTLIQASIFCWNNNKTEHNSAVHLTQCHCCWSTVSSWWSYESQRSTSCCQCEARERYVSGSGVMVVLHGWVVTLFLTKVLCVCLCAYMCLWGLSEILPVNRGCNLTWWKHEQNSAAFNYGNLLYM